MGEGKFSSYDQPAAAMPSTMPDNRLGHIEPPRPVSMLDRIGQLEKEIAIFGDRFANFERETVSQIRILRQIVEQAVGIALP